jgi:uncharacterized lipoprotein YajG
MLRNRKKLSFCGSAVSVLAAVMLLGGCAAGTTEVKVSHGPLNAVSNTKEGNLLIKRFVDNRKETKYVGNKRNGFGMVLGHVGLHGDKSLESILTQYFAEALQEAGYTVTVHDGISELDFSQATFNAVIEGEIVEFWMDLYMAVWHRVGVNIRAINPANEQVLWEDRIEGAEKRTLWAGATGEYERIIREALTIALNRALEKFASDDFYNSITER